MRPISENVNTASNRAETIRPRPRRWSALSQGLNRKVSKIASATGNRTGRAQYSEATISTSVPATTSGDNLGAFVGIERVPSDCCQMSLPEFTPVAAGANTP